MGSSPGDPSTGTDAGTGSCAFGDEPCAGCGQVACIAGELICRAPSPGCAVFVELASVESRGEREDEFEPGLAWGDIDGDGWSDLVLGTDDGLLWLMNDGAGGVRRGEPVAEPPRDVLGVSLADYDGDRDLDLLVTTSSSGLHLYRNDGGAFSDVTNEVGFPPVDWPTGAAWGDFDGDGWLDVFVSNMQGPSLLLHNDGGAGFTDVAEEHGVDDPSAPSLQAVFFDYDLDGDVDLFVANDKGPALGRPSTLYRNDGGRLSDVGAEVGVADLANGMGLAVGDVDGDLDLDLYLTDIGAVDGGQRLYLNQGDGSFVESAWALGLQAAAHYAWGVELVDLDNDRDLDVVMASTGPDDPFIAESLDGLAFVEVSAVIDSLPRRPQVALGVADVDRDGRMDVSFGFLPGTGDRAEVLRNVTEASGHWFRVELRGSPPNVFGVGGTVEIESHGGRQIRPILAGGSYLGSHEAAVHFGLGEDTEVEAVEVRWPGGRTTRTTGPFDADQAVVIGAAGDVWL